MYIQDGNGGACSIFAAVPTDLGELKGSWCRRPRGAQETIWVSI